MIELESVSAARRVEGMSFAAKSGLTAVLLLFAFTQMRSYGQTTPATYPVPDFERITDSDAVGSTNVPMDSWIYPALGRRLCVEGLSRAVAGLSSQVTGKSSRRRGRRAGIGV